MRFNPKASLDSSRVQDGGGSGGGFGGTGIGVPHIAGGGVGSLVIALVIYLLIHVLSGGSGGLDGSMFTGSASSAAPALSGSGSFDYSSCKTGADANDHPECALVAVENSLVDYWSKEPQVASSFKPENAIVVFHGSVQTGGCGTADTNVGPFYCSGDQNIYLDTAFYDTVFKQLGGDATPFVRAYVIAHEYGHHIQDVLGEMKNVKTQQGQNSDSVRLELQADCYAGMWADNAANVPDEQGNTLIEDLTTDDIDQAIKATQVVGDDYIEKKASGSVTPDQWTHGSSAEREAWFEQGFKVAGPANDIQQCSTWDATDLTRPASIS